MVSKKSNPWSVRLDGDFEITRIRVDREGKSYRYARITMYDDHFGSASISVPMNELETFAVDILSKIQGDKDD